jgi:hypothetical protein
MTKIRLCGDGGQCGLRCERWWDVDDGRGFVEVDIVGEAAAGFEEVVAGQLAILVKFKYLAVRASWRFRGDGAEKFD